VWQSSLSHYRQSKFGWNVAGGSIEVSDFGADVNSCAPTNYSVFTRQAQLGRCTKLGGITNLFVLVRYVFTTRRELHAIFKGLKL